MPKSSPVKLSFLLVNDESGILLMTQCVLEEYMSAHGIHATYHTAINYNSAKELLETQRIDKLGV